MREIFSWSEISVWVFADGPETYGGRYLLEREWVRVRKTLYPGLYETRRNTESGGKE